MTISRRQFLRACMYAAPAAVVAPKAISYFLPPQILTGDEMWNSWFTVHAGGRAVNIPIFGTPDVMLASPEMIKLIESRMNAAADSLARNIYNSAPTVTKGFGLDRILRP